MIVLLFIVNICNLILEVICSIFNLLFIILIFFKFEKLLLNFKEFCIKLNIVIEVVYIGILLVVYVNERLEEV